jgi:polysaccharide deacetylase family protein (PEP-CTERM system associated)
VNETQTNRVAGSASPHGGAILNAFSVDVEEYFHVEAFKSVIARSTWGEYPTRVVNSTDRILELLELHGVKGTFFVLGWVARRFPDLVRRVAAAGHEVASHGMSHSLIYTQTPDEFRRETRESKKMLEDLSQCPVIGYRAATYSITAQSLWALDILCEEGFQYDSSIFPVRHDRYGIPGSNVAPHVREPKPGYRLAEFPLTTKGVLGYRLPVAGGGYFRLFPYWLTRTAFRRIIGKEGRPIIFYMHPWEIDPEQPRISAGRLSRFRHYQNLEKCEARLQQLLKDFQFGTVAKVLQQCGLLAADAPVKDEKWVKEGRTRGGGDA